jgi:hypothetical protein
MCYNYRQKYNFFIKHYENSCFSKEFLSVGGPLRFFETVVRIANNTLHTMYKLRATEHVWESAKRDCVSELHYSTRFLICELGVRQ